MTPSENCYALIRRHEGLRLKAYYCPAGVLTIGYGHTGGVQVGQTWTVEEAEAALRYDCLQAAFVLHDLELNQNQFDAVTALVFNIGRAAFAKSTMRRLLADGLYRQAAEQFPRWVFAGGKKLPGLVVRREDERALFERPV